MSLSDKEFMRYNRHIMVDKIGEQGQLTFKHAKVAIVGIGGLGCPAAQYLVASGIGHLILIDHDHIELSNLQRQILFSTEDIGRSKAATAQKKLQPLNPHCQITALTQSVFDTELDVLLDDVDLVLDCTDNPNTRQFINQACVDSGVKLVSASAIQGAGQMISFDFSTPDSPCYQCLFSDVDEQPNNCQTSGVFSPLLGVMGSLQATEALRLLLGITNNLNKLMLFDAFGMEIRQFKVAKDSQCRCCNLST